MCFFYEMYFIRNDEMKMLNQSIEFMFTALKKAEVRNEQVAPLRDEEITTKLSDVKWSANGF